MNWYGMRMYLASPRLSDFSIPKEFYEFYAPSPTPDLSYLRESLDIDLELARELFIPEPFCDDD